MSEPDGPDATRRTLIRGAVVLGAVGAGAGLSFIGDGTYKAASDESDVATQAPAPSAEPGASAEPTASAKPTKKPAKASKSAKPEASGKATKSEQPTKSEKPTKSKETKKATKAKPAGTPLGPTSKVPVGGGAIFKDKRLVVTQPTKGTFKSYDALCTHAACLVGDVKDNAIHCPCHNAKFSAADGSVIKPSVARRPLAPKGTVTEADGTLYLT